MRFKAYKIMTKFRNVIGMCFLFVSVLTSSMALAQMNTEDRFRLDSIEIQGNERVTDGTVLAYLPVQVGDEITLATSFGLPTLPIGWFSFIFF